MTFVDSSISTDELVGYGGLPTLSSESAIFVFTNDKPTNEASCQFTLSIRKDSTVKHLLFVATSACEKESWCFHISQVNTQIIRINLEKYFQPIRLKCIDNLNYLNIVDSKDTKSPTKISQEEKYVYV